MVADVHHDEAHQHLSAFYLLNKLQVFLLFVVQISPVTPQRNKVYAVWKTFERVVEHGCLSGPVTKPAEGLWMIAVFVLAQFGVIFIAFVGDGQVGRVLNFRFCPVAACREGHRSHRKAQQGFILDIH